MPFNPNFTSVSLAANGTLVANGSSGSGDVDKATLLARHVVILQGDNVAEGPATADPGWTTNPALDANGITKGDAAAFGSETFFRTDPPAFLTFTWSETVVID